MSTQKEFINNLQIHATQLAKKYGLYASVMIAQAIHESGWGKSSLSLPPNYNLFGIKGSYNGKSVIMKTWEDDGKGHPYYINASFRKYPSYYESMEDNAKLLRNGISGNSSFYSGAWKEKAKTYREATQWLQGRYATDTQYASKLNAIIQGYNLTKYDVTYSNISGNIYKENGVFYPNDTIIVRDIPSTTGKIIARYYKGEKVLYHTIHLKNGYVWLQYDRSNGKQGYIPCRTFVNGVYGKIWGDII